MLLTILISTIYREKVSQHYWCTFTYNLVPFYTWASNTFNLRYMVIPHDWYCSVLPMTCYIHFNPFSCTQASTTRRFVYAQIRSNKLNERDSPEGNVLSVNFYHTKKGWILSTLYKATIKTHFSSVILSYVVRFLAYFFIKVDV